MEHKNYYGMVISTCESKETAQAIARALIESKLAACVQMLPVESMYTWQGKVCEGSETALFIKTKTALFDKAAAAIREIHPYEVPEIIQIPLTDGLPAYLKWIDDCVI